MNNESESSVMRQSRTAVDPQVVLAARVILAVADYLDRSASSFTYATLTDDGKTYPSHVYYDRLSSAVANATLNADLYGVLAYSVRKNDDNSFTVYGGPTVITTMNRAEARRVEQ